MHNSVLVVCVKSYENILRFVVVSGQNMKKFNTFARHCNVVVKWKIQDFQPSSVCNLLTGLCGSTSVRKGGVKADKIAHCSSTLIIIISLQMHCLSVKRKMMGRRTSFWKHWKPTDGIRVLMALTWALKAFLFFIVCSKSGEMVKSAGLLYWSALTSRTEAGLFCCISAFLTFTRGAHVWVWGGEGSGQQARLHAPCKESSFCCGSVISSH